MIMFLNDRGEAEEGQGSGVTREALSIFWREFFNSLAVGASDKVPSIRHDYQKNEWKSIGNVLVFGFLAEKFFPLQLSKAFVASCLFKEEMIPKHILVEVFYDYISRDESETLKKAVTGESDPSSDEDVIEVLLTYKCFRVVSNENLQQIIEEMAHQELIQRPRYISNAWAPILCKLKMCEEFKSVDSVMKVYDRKPSPKKVARMLSANPVNPQQTECFEHLKRFVKSLDDSTLGVFLQFVTGSNYLTVESITVDFSKLEGAARTPVAHTCGCVLIIPETYQGYNELSEEFSIVLRHRASWGFEIV